MNCKGTPGLCRHCGRAARKRETLCVSCRKWYVLDGKTDPRPTNPSESAEDLRALLQSLDLDSVSFLSLPTRVKYEARKVLKP